MADVEWPSSLEAMEAARRAVELLAERWPGVTFTAHDDGVGGSSVFATIDGRKVTICLSLPNPTRWLPWDQAACGLVYPDDDAVSAFARALEIKEPLRESGDEGEMPRG